MNSSFKQQYASLKNYLKKTKKEEKIALLVILLLVIVLPLTLLIISRSTESRNQAAGPISIPITNPPVCVTPPICGAGYYLSVEINPTNGCAEYTCLPNVVITNTPTPILSCTGRPIGKEADFNNTGLVDLSDYSIFLSEVLKDLPVYTADANCDHRVDLRDYSILLNQLLK